MLSFFLKRVVVDTNVVVGALIRPAGVNRAVMRACFEDRLQPLIGENLFLEYEDVMGRARLFQGSPLPSAERRTLLASFLSICTWVNVYYYWRPNLRDESDNHLVELAVAGGASAIITSNVADFRRAELQFPGISISTPAAIMEAL